jgi:hypothetical protein
MKQPGESPVLKAIFNSEFKNTIIVDEFIKRKIQDGIEIDLYDYELISAFKKLNHEGKIQAIHRVKELSFIPDYSAEIGELDENN